MFLIIPRCSKFELKSFLEVLNTQTEDIFSITVYLIIDEINEDFSHVIGVLTHTLNHISSLKDVNLVISGVINITVLRMIYTLYHVIDITVLYSSKLILGPEELSEEETEKRLKSLIKEFSNSTEIDQKLKNIIWHL